MDTTTVLDKYTQDLSNLPLEVKHLLQELKNKDIQLSEARKRYQTKDNQIHKFIRSNGTLTKHPKEQQLYNKIEEDMETVSKLQKEKILLSNTALFLISKHLYNFETDIAKLERDELLPPIESVLEVEVDKDDTPSISTPKVSVSIGEVKKSSGVNGGGLKRKSIKMNGSTRPNKRAKSEEIDVMNKNDAYNLESLAMESKFENDSLGVSINDAGIGGGPLDATGSANSASLQLHSGTAPANGEDADNRLYCFCQRVSFGEMIGCDNDDCKYEWFHWSCVGISSPPKDDDIWYCPDCAPKMEKRKKKRKT